MILWYKISSKHNRPGGFMALRALPRLSPEALAPRRASALKSTGRCHGGRARAALCRIDDCRLAVAGAPVLAEPSANRLATTKDLLPGYWRKGAKRRCRDQSWNLQQNQGTVRCHYIPIAGLVIPVRCLATCPKARKEGVETKAGISRRIRQLTCASVIPRNWRPRGHERRKAETRDERRETSRYGQKMRDG